MTGTEAEWRIWTSANDSVICVTLIINVFLVSNKARSISMSKNIQEMAKALQKIDFENIS